MLVAILILTQWSLADSLYAHHYYDLAQVEYQREFFFYPQLKKDQHKRLRFAIALMANNTSRGLDEFMAMVDEFPDLKSDIKIEMAKQYIYAGNYYQARLVLRETDGERLLGLTYILEDELSKAQHLFTSTGYHELANDIDAYRKQSKKSTKTAALLSLICPGAGEMYAGNMALGIKDFLLNAGSGFLFYNALKQKKYVDAVLIFNFLFQRFYLGSLYNAQISAFQANEKAKQLWLDEMKDKYFQDLIVDYWQIEINDYNSRIILGPIAQLVRAHAW